MSWRNIMGVAPPLAAGEDLHETEKYSPLAEHKEQNDNTNSEIVLLEELPDSYEKFNPSFQELNEFFQEEWDINCGDPYWLIGAIVMLREKNMIDAGIVPPWFTARAYCKNCGDVLLRQASRDKLVGCPWCFAAYKYKISE